MRVLKITACVFALMVLLPSASVRAVETTSGQLVAPSSQEASIAVQALKLASKQQWAQARGMAARTAHPAVKDTVNWMAYRYGAPGITYSEISAFVTAHPDWPHMDRIRMEAENHMPTTLPSGEVISWFQKNPPITPDGMEKYIVALTRQNNIGEVRKALRGWWADAKLDRDQQKRFFAKYNAYFDRDTNLKRYNTLLYRGDYANARGMTSVLPDGYAALTEARIGLAQSQPGVDTLIERVPASLSNDPGLRYERLRWRRRGEFNIGAIDLLNTAPASAQMDNPADWWLERHIMARRLIEEKKYAQAYQLVSTHRQTEGGVPFAEAEFLAGWIALRFVNKPWEAFEHFEKLYHNVKTPISKSRAAYWAGRASTVMNHQDVADKWYREGARYQTTFYGQLSAAAISEKTMIPEVRKPNIDSAARQNFDRNPMVLAAKWLNEAGARYESSAFLLKVEEEGKSPENYWLAADFAEKIGQRHIAIRIAQDAATETGYDFIDKAYPVIPEQLQGIQNVEWALVHSLIRQESRFDDQAVSYAGARGLMQLMPATAKEVARKINSSHQEDWLTSRPAHNIALGTGYLEQMLIRFDGNYAMAAAAYNAGPNRVARWADEYGDPRTGEIDIVDWIELIPISETRNYVQRVMEGVYVYRERLKNIQRKPDTPLHIALDYNH